MNAVFFNRDFTPAIPLQFQTVEVDRYSWTMYGGPDSASLRIMTSADKWEMAKLLRCPVEIHGGDGRCNWWGYVNKVTIPYGSMRVGIGLDNMFNKVAVTYSFMDTGSSASSEQKQTDWADDDVSVAEYGQKEAILNAQNCSLERAESMRDVYLGDHKFAPLEVEYSGGNDWIEVECVGWIRTLDWHFYSKATTTNVVTTTQISAIYNDSDQFFNGIIIVNASGISSNEYRDGKATAYTYIMELIAAGTSNDLPLLADVDQTRYLRIYERVAETSQSVLYTLCSDGRLESIGYTVPASHCVCSKWVSIKDLPAGIGGLTAVRSFFISNSEYDVKTDTCTYKPAGAFDAVRLAKWLAVDNQAPAPAIGIAGGVLPLPVYSPPVPAAATSNYTSYTWVVTSPEVAGVQGPKLKSAKKAAYITSAVVGGTSAKFNIETCSAPGGSGTNLLGSDQTATTSGASGTSSTSLAVDTWLWLDISEVTGEVDQLAVTLTVTPP